ncbi:Hpt domain-containing protein [Glaciimonas immobilis]|uniref:HPt (Histidine-containing phosphotransfer) domain-containing protein n=1 Tax=Glaciimonas immobilis TaxID=728004 RepID=A0A840RNT5_9BURK|nr:Hpt domain-containing protein [Glaciimonas immobilis]KAF3998978.1 Hpt domain-containing protein [Glaciimonas immobilis]MBB5198394.1 HPt (histidine-containing phosphotransfer) domain-containing protein [Glaciimonas immobilis]
MNQANSYIYIDPLVLFNATGGDIESFRSLSHTFLEIAPPMFERLKTAILVGDAKLIGREIHSFRGTTALVGAIQLTSSLVELEQLVQDQGVSYLAQHIGKLWLLFCLVTQEVKDSIMYFQGDLG